MNKYRARKTIMHGVKFDSAKEAKRYNELLMLERAGKIATIIVQPEFPIIVDDKPVRALPDSRGRRGRPIVYKGDFEYTCFERQARVVEDVKGMDTPVSRLKRALVQHIYGIEIEIV